MHGHSYELKLFAFINFNITYLSKWARYNIQAQFYVYLTNNVGKAKARTPANDLPQTTLCASRSDPEPVIDTTYRFSHNSRRPTSSKSTNTMSQSYSVSSTAYSFSKRPASASSARTSTTSSSPEQHRSHLRLSSTRSSSLQHHAATSYAYSKQSDLSLDNADDTSASYGDSDSDSCTQLRRRHSSAELPSSASPHTTLKESPRPSLGSSEYPAASKARRRANRKSKVAYANSASHSRHERVDGFATPQPRKSQSGRRTPRSSQRSRNLKASLDREADSGSPSSMRTSSSSRNSSDTSRTRPRASARKEYHPCATPAKNGNEQHSNVREKRPSAKAMCSPSSSPSKATASSLSSSPSSHRHQLKRPEFAASISAPVSASVSSASPSVISAHPCAPKSGPRDSMVVVGRFLVDEEPASPEPSKVEVYDCTHMCLFFLLFFSVFLFATFVNQLLIPYIWLI